MAAAEKGQKQHSRFQEPAKFLPVLFIVGIIMLLYLIYITLHCAPLLRAPGPNHGIAAETAIFNILTFLLMVCYGHCIFVHPGSVPDSQEDPSWEYVPVSKASGENMQMETKRTGERRHCKWCAKYKPDRCHHCRVCRTCILKMDHHCPWMYNCIGFKNYKYFFLLIMYAAIVCHYIFWSMMRTVKNAIAGYQAFMQLFLLLFGETLAAFFGALLSLFLLFHIWLMFKAMSTIEFCEKSMKKGGYDSSVYSRGAYGNVQAVLGDNPWLWFLPCAVPSGRGLYFLGEDAKLKRDLEPSRGKSRRTSSASAYGSIEDGQRETAEAVPNEPASQDTSDTASGISPGTAEVSP
jgi:hypothetical protein